ncbi:MAG: TlpA family protein disulfide reductase [Gammaproteobacteria bacterium]|jgi:thiol-disulfide isomerase/thioredoxin|nr:TlpA family protein disulfide reductase [Gammaproteobacteria bacterium]
MIGRAKSIFFLVFLLTCSMNVFANHDSNEVYDGTINSFRWLKTPLSVNHVTVKDEHGENVSISQFNGKIVLLNLWASWCKPCITELPALDRLQNRMNRSDFVILAVTIDEDINAAKAVFSDKLKLKGLGFYRESAEVLGQDFPVDVLPTSIIIDRQGQAMGLLRSNINWDEERTDLLINLLVSGSSTTSLILDQEQHSQIQ